MSIPLKRTCVEIPPEMENLNAFEVESSVLVFRKYRNMRVRQAPLRCILPDKIVTVDAFASLINSKSRRLLHFNLLRYVVELDFTPFSIRMRVERAQMEKHCRDNLLCEKGFHSEWD